MNYATLSEAFNVESFDKKKKKKEKSEDNNDILKNIKKNLVIVNQYNHHILSYQFQIKQWKNIMMHIRYF